MSVPLAQPVGAENLRGLPATQRAAVDDFGAGRVDDRNGGSAGAGALQRAEDHLRRSERAHSVVHGDELHSFARLQQAPQAGPHGVEPLLAPHGEQVPRNGKAGGEVAPEIDLRGRQDHRDGRSGQSLGEAVDRAGQYGQTVQQQELFGYRAPHASAGASSHDDDTGVQSRFHISFFPNPRVLSVHFSWLGRSCQSCSSMTAA